MIRPIEISFSKKYKRTDAVSLHLKAETDRVSDDGKNA
jgi:hypothetical protein